MAMHIGILGAGRMGQALARLLVGAGYSVRLANSRGPASLADFVAELGSQASASTPRELARSCDVVILATRWDQASAALGEAAPWDGTILIDTTNNRFGPNPGDVYDLGDQTSSEVIAAMAPGARLVKAFNHQPIPSLSTNLGPRRLNRTRSSLRATIPKRARRWRRSSAQLAANPSTWASYARVDGCLRRVVGHWLALDACSARPRRVRSSPRRARFP